MKNNDIIESLNDASIDRLLAVNLNWEIIAWNKMSESVTGILRNDIIGKKLFDVFPQFKNDPEIMDAWKYAMQGLKSFLPSADGLFNRSHHENHFTPLLDKDGELIGVMNVIHDVAHRIKAEKQLQKLNLALNHKYEQLKKVNSELATFTSITGTELKDPIKNIYTSLEFILTKDGQKLTDSSKAGLRRMQSSLNRMNLLLDDILALSNASIFSGEFTLVDLNDIINNALKKLEPKIIEKRAKIEVAKLPSIYGARDMLQNLFYNIIDNSLKFQETANIPCITISNCTVPGIGSTGKELLCVSVSDNGIGFSSEHKEEIFQMFKKLNPPKQFHGSGIGLTISHRIAEAHEGYIEAESEPGKGTTIHCYFAKDLHEKEI